MITPGVPSATIWSATFCSPAGGLPEAGPETFCPDSARGANVAADDPAATRSTAISTPVTRRTRRRARLLRKLMSFSPALAVWPESRTGLIARTSAAGIRLACTTHKPDVRNARPAGRLQDDALASSGGLLDIGRQRAVLARPRDTR